MTPHELKASILQQAIQGKLTPQLPTDGNANDLLRNISLANDVDGQRVKQKVINNITNDDMAFEIPASWAWVKLGNVCVIARGGSPRPIKEYLTNRKDGINWIKIGDTEKNGKYISSTAEKIKPSGVSKSRMVHAGDFLLTNSMSFGRPYILKIDGCIHDGWLVISQKSEIFIPDYLYWLLSSQYAYMQFCDKVSGAVVKNLNSDKVANSVFPLPPIAEQKRIVAKLEEILPLIDRYEAAWNKLEKFNKRFPGDMQKSILQLAIQGKLVKQRPEEGTGEELLQQIQAEKQALIKAGKIKKEKPLPEIAEDEIPFDLPENWRWVRLGRIVKKLTDGSHNPPPNSGSGYPVISAKNVKNGLITFENVDRFTDEAGFEKENPRTNISRGDVILGIIGGSIGNIAVYTHDRQVIAQRSIAIIESMIDTGYFVYVLKSPLLQNAMQAAAAGSAQGGVYLGTLSNFLVPLPPLAEQKRIVAKLEEIFPLCDRLR